MRAPTQVVMSTDPNTFAVEAVWMGHQKSDKKVHENILRLWANEEAVAAVEPVWIEGE